MLLIKNKALFIALLAILLVGCGFQLRGMRALPADFNNIAIVMQNTISHDIERLLRHQLQSYGITLIDNTTKANYWLILEKDGLSQQLTNIAASTVPRQYQLTYQLVYSLINKRLNQPIKTSKVVTVTRQLTINNNRILGSDFEGGIIVSEMHREAIMQLISRLSRT